MLRRTLATAMAWSLLLAAPALAQEEAAERGDLFEVVTWNVPPSVAPAWRGHVETLVEAATEADVADTWFMLSGPSTYRLVYPLDDYAELDDPMAFARQFRGTPGEAKFQEAMGALQAIEAHPLMSEIVEHVDSWSYDPSMPVERPRWAHIDWYWLEPGSMEAFGELAQDFVAFVREIGYPYAVDGHRIHFGDIGRVYFVTHVDDLSSYYGENDLERLVEAAGAQERFGELVQRFSSMVYRIEHENLRSEPELSYVGE